MSKRETALEIIRMEYAKYSKETRESMRAYVENRISSEARNEAVKRGLRIEHKFRGKRINTGTGEWVCGYYAYNPVLKEHKIITYEEDELLGLTQAVYGDKRNKKRRVQTTYVVDPVTVGEYIDKKDKAGNDICEGDLVKRDSGTIYIVTFNTNHAKFQLERIPDNYLLDWFELSAFDESVVIIGNKYDNPELIKETDQ